MKVSFACTYNFLLKLFGTNSNTDYTIYTCILFELKLTESIAIIKISFQNLSQAKLWKKT